MRPVLLLLLLPSIAIRRSLERVRARWQYDDDNEDAIAIWPLPRASVVYKWSYYVCVYVRCIDVYINIMCESHRQHIPGPYRSERIVVVIFHLHYV